MIRDAYGNQYTLVKARKRHRCPNSLWSVGECEQIIEPGSVYLRHVCFPGDVVEHLTILPECMGCARKAGRPGLPEATP